MFMKPEINNKKWINWVLISAFALLMSFLAFNKHAHSGLYNYRSELWADKSGYSVYLPFVFEYDMDINNFPDSIDFKTGTGFILNYSTGKVETRYTYAVALMQAPFYFLANAFVAENDPNPPGFSKSHHKSVNVAAVFWLVIGLLFLSKFLLLFYAKRVVLLTSFFILFATNLLNYSIDETGMSHVYSFSLFSMFLYFLKKIDISYKITILDLVKLTVTASMIVVIRPTNLLFILAAFFMVFNSWSAFLEKVKLLINFPKLAFITLLVFVVFLPQLLYWKYLSGSFINYSYGNIGFNWLHPVPQITLFSPNNGLLPYTPFFLIILISMVLMLIKPSLRKEGMVLTSLFILLTYVLSSWSQPNFGCSFGARSYVEYFSIFSIAFSFLLNQILEKSNAIKLPVFVILLGFVYLNIRMTYHFDECFFGTHNWDWTEYWRVISSKIN